MKIARDLLKAYSFERLTALLNQFFDSEDAWFAKCGYSLSCFKNAIPKLLLREGRRGLINGQSPSARPSAKSTLGPRLYSGWHRAGRNDETLRD